jgi:hypothetical protein
MIFPENRCPSPIGVEDMLFGIMLYPTGDQLPSGLRHAVPRAICGLPST